MVTLITTLLSCLIRGDANLSEQDCRHLDFRPELAFEGRRLLNHVIKAVKVVGLENCGALCFTEPNCTSYNIKLSPTSNGYHKCELNNDTHQGHENEMEINANYLYRGVDSACADNPCTSNATCQTGFTNKGYRCFCPGFTGKSCDRDINECASNTHHCSADAVCNNTEGSYNCKCKPGFQGDGVTCQDADECTNGTHNCKEYEVCLNTKGSYNCSRLPCQVLYQRNLSTNVILGHKERLVECFLLTGTGLGVCGKGIWKLVMKTDGHKLTFRYDSPLWSNKESFNLVGGESGFDNIETKLPTYWSSSFTKVCLGMKFHNQENAQFIVINKTADSLHSLIADGRYNATSVGRNTWKSLISSRFSLQPNCNKEGFNVKSGSNFARIGILGNNENDCNTCDSRICFGGGGHPNRNFTCGQLGGRNRDTKLMGYILIQ